MKDRIRQIMESKHMTQQVFAQFIDMSPASLSSIFNGRTKPTLNIVEAIKRKIPDINTNWLLFGIGDMYEHVPDETDARDGVSTGSVGEPTLDFGEGDFSTPTHQMASNQNNAQAGTNSNSVRNTRPEIIREEIKYIDKPQRKVVEIRVYYDDLTYESFVPAKK